LVYGDFIGLDNPDFEKFRMKISRESAERLLPQLPGNPEIYHSTVEKFLDEYENRPLAAA
jgi:hypothetical protein